jgi:hypothetical protein
VQQITEGLWRWTSPHPDWQPDAEPGSSMDWDREVACALYLTAADAVFIDPLLPPDPAPFWEWCDPLVAGRSASVLTTIHWHERSRAQVADRYDAAIPTFNDPVPEGVQSLVFGRTDETFFWLTAPRTLVVGDRILGGRAGGLRLCPESWMASLRNPMTQEQLRVLLAPVLELPVEHVLTSHGEPVLSDGARALAEILGG